ncbi:MAG: ligase-associated DNA damage response exonuclease [Methylobacteriaceae bacterium]|nr:ligase-associated DNA damage response exonuclease [Methylobacteriaceae bacterium]
MAESSAASAVLTTTPAGLYCPAGDFHIDPTRGAPRALVTHGHSDHARAGSAQVLATEATLAIMRARLGPNFAGASQSIRYGDPLTIGDARVTFFPAGHVLGSAQILIEAHGRRVVVSGDYKRAHDPTCASFEPIRCDAFVSEATFGLPVFRHPPAADEVAKLLASLRIFPERAHVVGAYSLGKAQRLLALLLEAGWDRPVWVHGAMESMIELYRAHGVRMVETRRVTTADKPKLAGEIVLCPPSAASDIWLRKIPDPLVAFASGWMRVRARARQRGVELPLVVSDHADWPELCATVRDVGCSELWVTHGAEEALAHWARTQGLAARPLHMIGFGDEDENLDEGDAPPAETDA